MQLRLLMSYKFARKWVKPKVFYYAYTPSTPSHTRCSRTGSDRQLKRSCHLDHSPYREAKTPKRVEEFFGFSKFWISANKRRSCVISNAVFGALFKLLAPSKNLHRGGHGPPAPPASTPLVRNCIELAEFLSAIWQLFLASYFVHFD